MLNGGEPGLRDPWGEGTEVDGVAYQLIPA